MTDEQQLLDAVQQLIDKKLPLPKELFANLFEWYAWHLSTYQGISLAGKRDYRASAQYLAYLEREWKAHPDFEFITDYFNQPYDPLNPHVLAAYHHEPGYQKEEYSYVVSSLEDCLSPASRRWGERTLGEFAGILPLPDYIHPSPTHQGFISYTLKGGGRAYFSRMVLKKLLPKKLKTLPQEVRRLAKSPKWNWLQYSSDEDRQGQDVIKWTKKVKRKPSLQPDWYKSRKKRELWVDYSLDEEKRRLLSNYVDPYTFWDLATGVHHPDDVHTFFTRQLELLDLSQIPTKPKTKKAKLDEGKQVRHKQLSLEFKE